MAGKQLRARAWHCGCIGERMRALRRTAKGTVPRCDVRLRKGHSMNASAPQHRVCALATAHRSELEYVDGRRNHNSSLAGLTRNHADHGDNPADHVEQTHSALSLSVPYNRKIHGSWKGSRKAARAHRREQKVVTGARRPAGKRRERGFSGRKTGHSGATRCLFRAQA